MNGKTVLIVEDNELNMKLVRSLLSVGGYRIVEAVDAEKGIEQARQDRPDLILMDIQLPGMDGLSATRILKADPALRDIPVIALTSHAMAGDDRKAVDAGCDGYLTKPIDTRSFLDTVGQILSQGARTSPGPRPEGFLLKSRVLIVDDDPLNVKLLAAKLPEERYETRFAYDGRQALDAAFSDSPDLILLDVMMPGLNGYEVTRMVKQDPRTHDIPIILVTALDGTDEKIKGMEAGADEFLNKPVNTVELLARMRSLLSLRQYREQLAMRSRSRQEFSVSGSPMEAADIPLGPSTILLVEDNPEDARLVEGYLAGESCRTERMARAEDALERARQGSVDVLLLDILLPGMDGFELCRRLKEDERTRAIQILMITCLQDLPSKIRGIELGADDFLVKPINREELRARVRAALRKKTYLDRLNTGLETAVHSAVTDGLTSLYNRAYLKHFLDLEVMRSARQAHPLALIMMDLDDFKRHNDTMGHPAGDRILRDFGQLLRASVRAIDLAARYGGDEFVIVLPYADRESAVQVAQRIHAMVNGRTPGESTAPWQGPSVSMGGAVYPVDGLSSDDMIRSADERLYRAKREGKARVCFEGSDAVRGAEPKDQEDSRQDLGMNPSDA
jgi:two-component system, cell cycle response regulator